MTKIMVNGIDIEVNDNDIISQICLKGGFIYRKDIAKKSFM